MQIEFEATFIDINVDEVREKLKQLGAELVRPETLMKRVVFVPPKQLPGAWMRVRDEGDRITLSIKQNVGNKIEDQKEVELTINDFGEGVKLLEAIGAEKKAYQETKRENWEYKGAEISIDTWPGLDPFVEVEAKDESIKIC